jgi:endoglucanase Acf2
MTKEIKTILDFCKRSKYKILRNGKHYKITLPNGVNVIISGTSSDRNAHKQIIRDFRKQGVIILT